MTMFFNAHKQKSTSELTLAEYNNIWTKFCFLDETGSLSDSKDPFFTIGLLKMSQPYYLQNRLHYERSKHHFYDELKFNKLSRANIAFAKLAIEALFDTKSVNFYSYTTKKDSDYFKTIFKNDQWIAYEEITLRLLDTSLAENEILMLIADHITTPRGVKFEVNTKKIFNSSKERLALAGVCRFDSRSNDLLQVIDLIIGAITYDLKLNAGIVSGSKYKIELLDFIKENLGVNNFSGGFKNRTFTVIVGENK